jgi:ABC-type nitrate/sulfonate/bicarbonate transport system ATPase subunit
MTPIIEARAVSFAYRNDSYSTQVLDAISISVSEGEIVTLVGPSGCGKSTLLRVLAGLVVPDSGEALVSQKTVNGPTEDVALIFQQSTLFPWLTVVQNVEFGLRSRLADRFEIREKAMQWLEAVELDDRASVRPSELSGGMLQRIALARALAYSPRILLLDEPFGSLDAISREEMHEVLTDLWVKTGMSILLVTHDVDEAVSLSDRVLLLTRRPTQVAAEHKISLPRPRVVKGVRCEGFEQIRNVIARDAHRLGD